MLAAILVSGVASAIVLRDLELDVRLPEHVFAGRAALGRIVLRNPRRWLPSFSVNVAAIKKESLKRWRWMPATFSFPPKRAPGEQWINLPDRKLHRVAEAKAAPGIFEGSAYFPYIPAGSELKADLALRFARRGVYQQAAFGLATRFPFAFLLKTRRLPLAREIIVYPRVEPADEFFEVLPMITGEFKSFVRGRGDDLYLIREYMPEDSARHVDWKATAKSGSLKVREFAREDERRLCIAFDNPEPGLISERAYEKAVDLTASLAWHFSTQEAEVSFVVPGRPRTRDLHEFLAWLAVIEPGMVPTMSGSDTIKSKTAAKAETIDSETNRAGGYRDPLREMNLGNSDDYNIVITARPRGTLPTALWNSSYFVFAAAEASPKVNSR